MVLHEPETMSEMQRCQTSHKRQIALSCSLQFSACLGSEFAEGWAVCSLVRSLFIAALLFRLDHSLGSLCISARLAFMQPGPLRRFQATEQTSQVP